MMLYATELGIPTLETIEAKDKIVFRVIPENQKIFGLLSYLSSRTIFTTSVITAKASGKVSKSQASRLRNGTARKVDLGDGGILSIS